MAFYEITYIARQELSEKEVEKLTTDFSKFIKDNSGKVIKTENWGSRQFAYEINKAKKGYYVFLGIECNAETLKELERRLRLNEDVIRSLTVRVEAISEEPSAIINEETNAESEEFRVASSEER